MRAGRGRSPTGGGLVPGRRHPAAPSGPDRAVHDDHPGSGQRGRPRSLSRSGAAVVCGQSRLRRERIARCPGRSAGSVERRAHATGVRSPVGRGGLRGLSRASRNLPSEPTRQQLQSLGVVRPPRSSPASSRSAPARPSTSSRRICSCPACMAVSFSTRDSSAPAVVEPRAFRPPRHRGRCRETQLGEHRVGVIAGPPVQVDEVAPRTRRRSPTCPCSDRPRRRRSTAAADRTDGPDRRRDSRPRCRSGASPRPGGSSPWGSWGGAARTRSARRPTSAPGVGTPAGTRGRRRGSVCSAHRHARRRARRAAQPFRAPDMTPWMNCRWKNMYKISTGRATSTAAAAIRLSCWV